MSDDTEAGQNGCAKLASSVITLIKQNNLISGSQFRHQVTCHGSHSRGKRHTRFAALQGRQFALQDFFCGIAISPVLFTRELSGHIFKKGLCILKGVRGGTENWIRYRVTRFNPIFTTVDT
jgi:hypothetical protein